MEETGEPSKKKKVILGVESATGRAIQRKNASPPVGYARRLDIGIRIVQRKEKTEEEHPAMDEAKINQVQGKGTSPKRGGTHLIQEKTTKSQTRTTGQDQTAQTNQDQQTMTDQADQGLDPDQITKKIHLQEVKRVKESQTKEDTTETSELLPPTRLEELEAEPTPLLPSRSRSLRRQVTRSLRMTG